MDVPVEISKVTGHCLGFILLLIRKSAFNRLVGQLLVGQQTPICFKKLLIIVIGPMGAGKTTFVANYLSQYHPFIVSPERLVTPVEGIFSLLKYDLKYSLTFWNRVIARMKQKCVHAIKRKLVSRALSSGFFTTVSISSNKSAFIHEFMSIAKRFHYKIALIQITCAEDELRHRLEKRDQELQSRGLYGFWSFFAEIQRKKETGLDKQIDDESEVNVIIDYNSNTNLFHSDEHARLFHLLQEDLKV